VKDQSSAREGVSSFAKSLFFGEIHEDLVFPYPLSDEAEQDKVRSLIASAREFAAESIDMDKIEEEGWIGDDVVRGLGERGRAGSTYPSSTAAKACRRRATVACSRRSRRSTRPSRW
jgi:hypothetical protein